MIKKQKREDLGFAREVLSSFSFIEAYNYSVNEEHETLVGYRGTFGYINIYHGRSSYEIGIHVYPPNEYPKDGYSMSELMRLIDAEKAKKYRNPIAMTPFDVNKYVKEQAQRFEKYGQRILSGDSSIWPELMQQKQKWAEEYATNMLLSQSRIEAKVSFRKHNLQRVIDLLKDFEKLLTPSEKKMLEYAKKHSSGKQEAD